MPGPVEWHVYDLDHSYSSARTCRVTRVMWHNLGTDDAMTFLMTHSWKNLIASFVAASRWRGDTSLHFGLPEHATNVHTRRGGTGDAPIGVESSCQTRGMAAILQRSRCKLTSWGGYHSQVACTLLCWRPQAYHTWFCEKCEPAWESQCSLLLVRTLLTLEFLIVILLPFI